VSPGHKWGQLGHERGAPGFLFFTLSGPFWHQFAVPTQSKTIDNALDIIPRLTGAKQLNFWGVMVKKTSVSIGRNRYAWGAKHPHSAQVRSKLEVSAFR